MANLDEDAVPLTTLCISRKDGEFVRIGDNIRVRVECPCRVRLHITAPYHVRILRAELEPRP